MSRKKWHSTCYRPRKRIQPICFTLFRALCVKKLHAGGKDRMRMRNIDEHLSRSMNTFFTSRRAAAFFLAAISLVEVTGCGRKHRSMVASVPRAPAQRPMTAVPLGYTEEGIASWYGHPYHGRPAADGEIYDMEKLVAAHRLMPFNTWVRVTNLQNGKAIDVRIIDRGPFVEGRIIDLSKAAARQIGLLGPGIGRVRLEVTGAPPDIPSNDFYAVQVGAFSVAANAERVRMQYAQRFGTAQLALKQGA